MIVCIAEKPSVAQDIARILGANQQKKGYWEGGNYQVTWTYGHLCELKYPEDYDIVWKRWDLSLLPMIPQRFGIRLKKDKGVESQFEVIERLFSKAEYIVNCGDAGQEGELIQRWVMQKSKATCPVKRLWISSMTDEAIREGFANLRSDKEYKSLYEAGLCRVIGDWILGMNATRLYTLKYGGHSTGRSVLSIGRVQTPTLALIVQRQREIDNFVPQPYWVLSTIYKNTTFTAVINEEDDKSNRRGFRKEEEATEALQKIKDSPFVVDKVEKKNGKEAPPRLFDLTSLQVECNKKLALTAEQTLQVIQSLYEKKITTYPRVDTTYLPDDMYPKCESILKGISTRYHSMLEPLRGKPLIKRKKVFDSSKVTDHHAIIPTGQTPRALTQLEQEVFDLIAVRFISIFYDDCKFSTTTVEGHASDVPFKVTGKQILEAGWRELYNKPSAKEEDTSGESSEQEKILPPFIKGEQGAHQPGLVQKTTQAPKPYTEATLLRAMETAGKNVEDEELREALKDNGIGRPSTRAAIIETLFKRNYIGRNRKSLYATATGIELIGIIKEDLLKSAELTGLWEKKLREIERKEYAAPLFVKEMKDLIYKIVQQVLNDTSKQKVTIISPKHTTAPTTLGENKSKSTKKTVLRAGSKCPKCNIGKIIKGKQAYGCSRWNEGCNFRKPYK